MSWYFILVSYSFCMSKKSASKENISWKLSNEVGAPKLVGVAPSSGYPSRCPVVSVSIDVGCEGETERERGSSTNKMLQVGGMRHPYTKKRQELHRE